MDVLYTSFQCARVTCLDARQLDWQIHKSKDTALTSTWLKTGT